MRKNFTIGNLDAFAAIAKEFALAVKGGRLVIALAGDLGAGKTTFTQIAAAALGVKRPVTSPTFALVSEYPLPSGQRLVHMDLYRLSSPDELDGLGFEEYLLSDDMVFIEWPDRAGEMLPEERLDINISLADGSPSLRKIEFSYRGANPPAGLGDFLA